MSQFVGQRLRAFDGIELLSLAAGVVLAVAVALWF
jgi:hypothetical protein